MRRDIDLALRVGTLLDVAREVLHDCVAVSCDADAASGCERDLERAGLFADLARTVLTGGAPDRSEVETEHGRGRAG